MSKSASVGSATVGLVLSGGGAKGAYQVGVLKALNELNVQVDVVAGASIGALNGAIMAAAIDQQQAAKNLEELWLELAQTSPLIMNAKSSRLPAYLGLLSGFGLTSPMLGAVGDALGRLSNLQGIGNTVKQLVDWAGLENSSSNGLLCNQGVKVLIDRYLGDKVLPERLPLHVSVYPTQGAGIDILRIVGSALSVGDTADSQFLHVQSLIATDQMKVLLASAALPLLYASQQVNGQLYSDGGQGGWRNAQGNTPITPLLKAGCKQIVVTHLSDGSMWDRSQFPDATIIEIRPKTSAITRKGAVSDLLGFDNEKIPSWIKQGYEDTHACIGPILKTLNTFGELNESERVRDEALNRTGVDTLRDAMRRLNG